MATQVATGSHAVHAAGAMEAASDSPYFEHEEEISRQPYSIHAWLHFLMAAGNAPPTVRYSIYERALQVLPRSYKLWKKYLDEYYETNVRGKRLDAGSYDHLVALYERALVQLQTMPRIWLSYLSLLQHMKRVTSCRHAFNRALRALPITQHHRLWTPFVEYVKKVGVPSTVRSVYRRYLLLEPSKREQYVEYLCTTHLYDEASEQLVLLIQNHDQYPTSQTTHSLWMQLCDMVSQHPTQVSSSLDVEEILRSGIAQFTDEVGRLWCSLATYYVRLGLFESARDVYEEGIRTVVTVRDFSMIFDAYVQFVEAMLTTEMELAEPEKDKDKDTHHHHQTQVDRLLKIYEDLADRRPLLLNSVLLRQNKNNVREWEKRVELYKSDPQKVIRTFAEAVKTIDSMKSGGRINGLWIKFAKFYEDNKKLQDARAIFKKALEVEYRTEEELAAVYCAWAEMELRQDNFDDALQVVRTACEIPDAMTARLRQKAATKLRAKDKVHTCVTLWTLRLDLEESLGDMKTTRAAYDDAFELLLITPAMVLNYASYLQENKFFEESFRVYERGLALFTTFPHALEIWQAYLTQFVTRYGGTKVERARDLHEQAITAAPEKYAKDLYEKYADFEEKHGMLRNVMSVYERATTVVPEDERLAVFAAYIKKAHKLFGVGKVRDIYQQGIGALDDKYVPPLCLEFAKMETKLGEFERARVIYGHASQFCDPRKFEETFWQIWHDFEVAHGSEHSFLEMLRIKRSVVAQYSTVNYISAEIAPQVMSASKAGGSGGAVTGVAGMVAAGSEATGAAVARRLPSGGDDAMAALEADVIQQGEDEDDHGNKRKLAGDGEEEKERNVRQKMVQVSNDEEIDLDDEEEEEEEEKDNEKDQNEFEERAMPATLYGSVKKS